MKTTYIAVIKVIVLIAFLSCALGVELVAADPDPMVREINKLTEEIDNHQIELDRVEFQLESTTKDIIKTYQQLDAQEASLKIQKQALNSRLGQVYKNYDTMVLSIFLDLHDFTDIWKKLNFLSIINAHDSQMLKANRLRLAKIRKLKEELARKKEEQISLKREKLAEYSLLQNSLLQKRALLEQKIRADAARAAAANSVSAAIGMENN